MMDVLCKAPATECKTTQ